jgi:hypothetical protein
MTRTLAALGGLRRLRAAWRERRTRHHLAGLSDRQLKRTSGSTATTWGASPGAGASTP